MSFPDIDLFPPFGGFPREGTRFLARLKKNNNREWFATHKREYEELVKFPMQSLIASLREPLSKIAPELDVDPKRSMFRIYRDTRFSGDKRPYKTHAAAIFHERGRKNAGLYLHIEPGEVYLGGGIYGPDSAQQKRIREAISEHADEFRAIVESTRFNKMFGSLEGSTLVRPPRGFSADDPMIRYLKFKNYFAGVSWKERECHSAGFVTKTARVYKELLPLLRFINRALN
jgi:uncharacterized protein (TIGR02453 family)